MAYVSSEALCEITTQLRETGELSDGKIILDDGSEFKIHKVLLATGSGYFNMLFSWHPDQKDFHLKELVSKEAMEQILSWMYSHKLDLKEENLPDVLKTALYLDCFEVTSWTFALKMFWAFGTLQPSTRFMTWRRSSFNLPPITTTKFKRQRSLQS